MQKDTLIFRLDKDTKAAIEAKAKKIDRSLSKTVEITIRDALIKEGYLTEQK